MSRLSTLHTQLTRRHTAHIYMPSHTQTCTYAYEDSRKYHEIYGGFPICIACVHEFRVCSAQGRPLVSPASVMSVRVCVCVLIGIPVVLCVRVCVCVCSVYVYACIYIIDNIKWASRNLFSFMASTLSDFQRVHIRTRQCCSRVLKYEYLGYGMVWYSMKDVTGSN